MKYVCSVCGYVYDEEVEGVPFSELPDDWACPMCKAPKSLFFAEDREIDDVKTEHIDVIDEDMTEIPPLVLFPRPIGRGLPLRPGKKALR